MIDFVPVRNAEEVERWSGHLARWIYLTSTPSFDVIFGDAASAVRGLQGWVRRPTSEFSGAAATIALSETVPVGAFLALRGAEVHKRRSIDTLYVMKDCKPERRTLLKQLLTPFAAAHEPLGDDEFYLRSLAVDEGQRGRGFARALLQRFLDDGTAAGYRRFRLEVAADNRPALALYQRMGFTTFREAEIAGFGWSTCLMRLEK